MLELTCSAASGRVEGGRVQTFLLEAHRVVAQGAGERGFHVVHALLAAPEAAALGLAPAPAAGWRFARCGASPGDGAKWRAIQKVADALAVPEGARRGWWAALACVLHLGEVQFVEAEGGAVALRGGGDAALALARLLGAPPGALEAALTHKALRVKGEALAAARSAAGAVAAAASLAKGIYRAVFAAVVEACGAPAGDGGAAAPSAGVAALIADVFGFEVPAAPGFDALCVNAANSSLHDLFSAMALGEEQALFAAEGLPWSAVALQSEAGCLAALFGPGASVFHLLNDEQLTQGASGAGGGGALEAGLRARVAPRAEVAGALVLGDAPGTFTVRHYAADVAYDCTGMADANVDTLDATLRALLAGAVAPLSPAGWLAAAFAPPQQAAAAGGGGGGGAAAPPPPSALSGPSLGSTLRGNLAELSALLRASTVQWVRCVRPNDRKAPFAPEAGLVARQVAALGLPAAVSIRRSGFAAHFDGAAFAARFAPLTSATWPRRAGGGGGAAALLAALRVPPPPLPASPAAAVAAWALSPTRAPCDAGSPLPPGAAVLGASRVFVKDATLLRALEFCLAAAQCRAAARAGAAWRGHAARKAWARARARVARLQALWRGRAARRARAARAAAAAQLSAWARGCLARGAQREAREALGLRRSFGGKPRRSESLAWERSGGVDWAALRAGGGGGGGGGGAVAAALARRLADPRELAFSCWALKVRPEGWRVALRVVALTTARAAAAPALLLTFKPSGALASAIPLAEVASLWLSPHGDDLLGVVCKGGKRAYPLILVTPQKVLLAKRVPRHRIRRRRPPKQCQRRNSTPPLPPPHTHTHTHTHTHHTQARARAPPSHSGRSRPQRRRSPWSWRTASSSQSGASTARWWSWRRGRRAQTRRRRRARPPWGRCRRR